MTLLQIAFKNITRDKHTYFSYFISSTATIFLFYLFTAAAMHPNLNQIQDGSTLAFALGAGNFIIYIFAFLFVGYSSWAFLGSKGKQLGIYTILGMSPKQTKKMLFGENLLIGMGALITGLISGVVFSGLFFKLIRNIFETISFEMYVPVLPVFTTVLLFTVLFLVIGFITPYFISHRKVLWFLKSDKAYGENSRVSLKTLVLSAFVLTLTVVIMIPKIGNKLGDLWTPAAFLGIVGFLFLITPQIGAVYCAGKKRSEKHWKGIRLFADAEASTALWENRHMMSLNAVLLTAAFLAICALGSMQNNVVETVESITPFAYSYIERPGNVRAEGDIRYLDEALLSDGSLQKISYRILREQYTYGFLKESDFNKILAAKGKAPVELGNGELLILPGEAGMDAEKLSVREEVQTLLKASKISAEKVSRMEQAVAMTGSFQEIYVVKDADWERLAGQTDSKLYIEALTVYEDADWLNHLEQARKLEQALEHDFADYDYTYAFTTLGRYYETELLTRKLCFFVGFSISLIFLVASVSLVYFRLYTSLEREKKKYASMYKLGFSRKEMYQTLAHKIKLLLWIPFLAALAIMWAGIFYLDSQSAVSSVEMALKYSGVFIVLYFAFCRFVTGVYQRKITEFQ